MTRFAKLALSAATALSLATAPMPALADPDGDDIARALAGLAVLGVIAKIANDRKDNRRSTATSNGRWPQLGSIDQPYRGKIRRPGRHSAHGKNRYKNAPLPQRCLLIAETRRGDRHIYGKRCLNRNFKQASRLPARCETVIRTRRGSRTVYAASCLARDGWRVAGR